jgi:engulfment/cell motility protein 1
MSLHRCVGFFPRSSLLCTLHRERSTTRHCLRSSPPPQTIADQLSRPEARRCPISTVSNTVLHILAQHFSLLSPPSSAPTLIPNPYLFRLPELHSLVVSFFLRIWSDSSATTVDYDRITKLTESQVAYVLGGGGEKTWFKVRQEFNVADYRSVRERRNRELEMEDDIGSKASVRYVPLSSTPSCTRH